jgi:hypothetical protein
MIQRHGVALKGSMPVSLGGMSGVPGIGGETEIGEAVMPHDQTQLLKPGEITLNPAMGMHEDKGQNQYHSGNKQQEGVGLSHTVDFLTNLRKIRFCLPLDTTVQACSIKTFHQLGGNFREF